MAVNRDWAPRVGGGPHYSGKLVPMSGKLMEKFYKGLLFTFKITSSRNAGSEQRNTPLANGQASSSSIVLNVFNELWLCTGRLLVAAGNDRVPLTHGNLVKRCQLSAPFTLKRTWEGTAHLQDLDKIHEELPQKRLWPPFPQMSRHALCRTAVHGLDVTC